MPDFIGEERFAALLRHWAFINRIYLNSGHINSQVWVSVRTFLKVSLVELIT